MNTRERRNQQRMSMAIEFAARVRKLCKEEGKTLEWLANESDCTASQFTTARNGVLPMANMIANVANTLDVTVDYLLGLTGERGGEKADHGDSFVGGWCPHCNGRVWITGETLAEAMKGETSIQCAECEADISAMCKVDLIVHCVSGSHQWEAWNKHYGGEWVRRCINCGLEETRRVGR